MKKNIRLFCLIFFLATVFMRIPVVYSRAEIPDSLATTHTVYDDAQNNVTVYLIEDIHCHPQVQKNIAEILAVINSAQPISFIGIEGASGQLSFELFRSFPSYENAQKVCDYFLSTADISGSEYFCSTQLANGSEIPIWGLEDTTLYAENKENFSECILYSMEFHRIVAGLKGKTEKHIYQFLSPQEEKFLHMIYESEPSLTDIFPVLEQHSITFLEFPHITRYYEQWQKLSNIDSQSLLQDAVHLSQSLQAVQPQLTGTMQSLFFEYLNGSKTLTALLEQISHYSSDYPDITVSSAIQEYLLSYSQLTAISPDLFKDEMDALFQKIETHLTRNKVAAEFIELHRNLILLEQMAKLALTPLEYRELLSHLETIAQDTHQSSQLLSYLSSFPPLASSLPDSDEFGNTIAPFFSFYENAEKRDHQMAAEFFRLIEQNQSSQGSNTYVIITGGFHHSGLSELLTLNAINHTIVTPDIDEEYPYDRSLYFQRLHTAQSQFDSLLNDYLTGLQVWSHFAQTFPDTAAQTSAELFAAKLTLFLYGTGNPDDPRYAKWLASNYRYTQFDISVVAQNTGGIIYELQNRAKTREQFFFEIRFDENGQPDFRFNPFYSFGLDALQMESDDLFVNNLSWRFYERVLDDANLTRNSEFFRDFTRFMVLLRFNNPRLFFELSQLTANKINVAFAGTNESRTKTRNTALMRFNSVLDQAETAVNFIQLGIIQWNDLDVFHNVYRTLTETAQNQFGEDYSFALRVDTASKAAELSTTLLALDGTTPREVLIDHYLAHFASGLLRKESLADPALGIAPSVPLIGDLAGAFAAQRFDGIPPLTRLIRGDRLLTESPEADTRYFAQLAELVVREFSPAVLIAQGKEPFEELPDLPSLYHTSISSLSPQADRFLSFLERFANEDLHTTRILNRASGQQGRNIAETQIPLLIKQIDNLLPLLADKDLDLSGLLFARANLKAKTNDTVGAIEAATAFIDYVSTMDFTASPAVLDKTLHSISALSKTPWINPKQRADLEELYHTLATASPLQAMSDWADFGSIKQKELVVNNPNRQLYGTGRIVALAPDSFELKGISEETFRLRDMSRFSYLPQLPGYIYAPRSGRSIPEMASAETRYDTRPLLAAINGSNADWAAANAFLIIDDQFITKPVPGTHQKQRSPLSGTFNIIAFDSNNRPSMQTITVRDNILQGQHDIKWGMPGPAILKSGKVFPSLTVPDAISFTAGQQLGFTPSESEIRSSFSAMGITESGTLLLLTMTGEMNVPALAEILKQNGAKDAIILGGSGDAQMVSFGSPPVFAGERTDKALREGTEGLRKIGQGMLFFSTRDTAQQLFAQRLAALWQHDKSTTQAAGTFALLTLSGTDDTIFAAPTYAHITAALESLFYLEQGAVKGDKADSATQHIFLREKLPRYTVLQQYGFSNTEIQEILGSRNLYTLDTQDFVNLFILSDKNPDAVFRQFAAHINAPSADTALNTLRNLSAADTSSLLDFMDRFNGIPSPNTDALIQQRIIEESL